MADEGDILQNLDMDTDSLANGADNEPSVGIISQYIKDLSVENPNAPGVYQWTDAPQVDVQFNIASQRVNEEVHEVELKVTASATAQAGKAYLVELSYCGLIGARNLPEQHLHAYLFAEAPRLLFPFARAILADATRQAGFMPLMLDPIDFGAMYQQQMANAAQEQGASGDQPVGNA